jgi:hypothetical protein
MEIGRLQRLHGEATETGAQRRSELLIQPLRICDGNHGLGLAAARVSMALPAEQRSCFRTSPISAVDQDLQTPLGSHLTSTLRDEKNKRSQKRNNCCERVNKGVAASKKKNNSIRLCNASLCCFRVRARLQKRSRDGSLQSLIPRSMLWLQSFGRQIGGGVSIMTFGNESDKIGVFQGGIRRAPCSNSWTTAREQVTERFQDTWDGKKERVPSRNPHYAARRL